MKTIAPPPASRVGWVGGLAHVEVARGLDVEAGLPHVRARLGREGVRVADGVADRDVEPGRRLERRGDRAVAGRAVGGVGRVAEGPASRMAAALAARVSGVLALVATQAPAAPRPRPDPVTTAARPERSKDRLAAIGSASPA